MLDKFFTHLAFVVSGTVVAGSEVVVAAAGFVAGAYVEVVRNPDVVEVWGATVMVILVPIIFASYTIWVATCCSVPQSVKLSFLPFKGALVPNFSPC